MIKVNAAGFAGVMNVIIAIRSDKTVAFKLRALAYDAPASTANHTESGALMFL